MTSYAFFLCIFSIKLKNHRHELRTTVERANYSPYNASNF